jgi:hypothetical protein
MTANYAMPLLRSIALIVSIAAVAGLLVTVACSLTALRHRQAALRLREWDPATGELTRSEVERLHRTAFDRWTSRAQVARALTFGLGLLALSAAVAA